MHLISVDVAIVDCCDSCDGHACDGTSPPPRLGVSVRVFGKRVGWAERRLLRHLSRHITINGAEPPTSSGRRSPFKRYNG